MGQILYSSISADQSIYNNFVNILFLRNKNFLRYLSMINIWSEKYVHVHSIKTQPFKGINTKYIYIMLIPHIQQVLSWFFMYFNKSRCEYLSRAYGCIQIMATLALSNLTKLMRSHLLVYISFGFLKQKIYSIINILGLSICTYFLHKFHRIMIILLACCYLLLSCTDLGSYEVNHLFTFQNKYKTSMLIFFHSLEYPLSFFQFNIFIKNKSKLPPRPTPQNTRKLWKTI